MDISSICSLSQKTTCCKQRAPGKKNKTLAVATTKPLAGRNKTPAAAIINVGPRGGVKTIAIATTRERKEGGKSQSKNKRGRKKQKEQKRRRKREKTRNVPVNPLKATTTNQKRRKKRRRKKRKRLLVGVLAGW